MFPPRSGPRACSATNIKTRRIQFSLSPNLSASLESGCMQLLRVRCAAGPLDRQPEHSVDVNLNAREGRDTRGPQALVSPEWKPPSRSCHSEYRPMSRADGIRHINLNRSRCFRPCTLWMSPNRVPYFRVAGDPDGGRIPGVIPVITSPPGPGPQTLDRPSGERRDRDCRLFSDGTESEHARGMS